MGCKECGKPKCNGECGCKSPKVLQINNPAEYITFHKVSIPAAMGDSTTNPPKIGAYRNALVYYEADHTSWMYSTDGIPTLVTGEQGEQGEQGPQGETGPQGPRVPEEEVQEDVNNKLDAMAGDGTLAEIIAEYATTKEDYFYINSESTSADILSAFASPKSKIIEFENGTYNVTGSIILSSNTEVLLNGSTLNSTEDIGIFGYALDSTYTAYNGVSNVAIKNGKIGNSIALMHNTNITFENVEFLGSIKTHALQLGGCKHIVIDNCVFNGMIINDSSAEKNEIIQLEICNRGAQPYLIDENSASYDNTGNYDITISNCIFNDGDGVNSKQYICIGNHATYGLNTLYNKNINIISNTFNNAHFSQVNPACFENCLIENNTFTQPNTYTREVNNIYFKFINKDVIIRNNKFNGGDYNISSFGAGIGYNENIYIEGNEFNTEFDKAYSCNILLKNFKNVVINNNKFGKAFYKNIWVHNVTSSGVTYKATNVDITGNSFKTGNIISESKTCVHVRYGENINICRNIFTLSNANDICIYILGADVNGYLVSDNDEITSHLTKRIVSGTNLNYTNIYDGYRKLAENQTQYSAITDGSLAENLAHFNRLCLVLHKSGDASVMYTSVIKEYDPTQRFQIGRTYPLSFADASGNLLTGVLSLNTTDNTYSWTSPNSLTLRTVYGFNEV